MTDSMERFLTGKGAFVADLDFPDLIHLKIVRSVYARAIVRSVKGGITAKDVKAYMSAVGEGGAGGTGPVAYPVLARDRVNYVGQPVAAVTGETAAEAEDLLDSVTVDYEPLKAVADPEAALRADPIHPGTKSNVFGEGQVGRRFEDPASPVVVEETLRNVRVVPNPLEPRGVVVRWDGRRLTVFASTQSVPSFQEGFCESLKLPKRAVRVIQMDTGGAFGSKGGIYPEYIVAAHVAMQRKRPVRWIETRQEHLQATEQGRGARARMRLFADREGHVLGLKGDLLIDGGAYSAGMADWSPRWIGMQTTGPYHIPKAHVTGRAVYTNKVPLGPYRGAGRPEAAFFIERMMDFLADEIRVDPVEVRLRNAVDAAFKSPTGLQVPPFKSFLEDAIRETGDRNRAPSGNVGFSAFVLVPAANSGEGARIAWRDGRIKVWLGGKPHGQGHEVFVRRLVSEELDVDPSLIDLEPSDTDALAKGVGSWGSRTAIVGGGAVIEAARKLKARVRQKGPYAAKKLLAGKYDVKVFYKPEGNFNSLGANLVAADLDEFGLVRVRDVVAYYDAGEVLNRPMLESQVAGGSAQGMGQVLSEGAWYDEEGQPLVGTIGDAGLLSATEMPTFVVKTAKTRSNTPHGAKGVGESPAIGVPPALVRAVERQAGHRLTETPLRPEVLVAPVKA
ncbi:MAG TPA: xanthine dehydrogenase family protein molybdopterin-binding subunit [Thermoplasmata archaeon]|nr:xanthine dehydrogenase family protein molybdopterin-binding subunit [Thermoplasmata archaeon]